MTSDEEFQIDALAGFLPLAAHLPFDGFKESEIAAFLRRVELTGLASELSRE